MWDFFRDIGFQFDSIDVKIGGKKVEWFTDPYLNLDNFNGWKVEFIFIVKNEGMLDEEWTKKYVPVHLTLKRGGKEFTISFVGDINVYHVSEFDEFTERCVEINSVGEIVMGEPGQIIFLN